MKKITHLLVIIIAIVVGAGCKSHTPVHTETECENAIIAYKDTLNRGNSQCTLPACAINGMRVTLQEALPGIDIKHSFPGFDTIQSVTLVRAVVTQPEIDRMMLADECNWSWFVTTHIDEQVISFLKKEYPIVIWYGKGDSASIHMAVNDSFFLTLNVHSIGVKADNSDEEYMNRLEIGGKKAILVTNANKDGISKDIKTKYPILFNYKRLR